MVTPRTPLDLRPCRTLAEAILDRCTRQLEERPRKISLAGSQEPRELLITETNRTTGEISPRSTSSNGAKSKSPYLDACEFLRLPPKERLALCRRLAEQTIELASAAVEPQCRVGYLDIALQWLVLAEKIERAQLKRITLTAPVMIRVTAATTAASAGNNAMVVCTHTTTTIFIRNTDRVWARLASSQVH